MGDAAQSDKRQPAVVERTRSTTLKQVLVVTASAYRSLEWLQDRLVRVLGLSAQGRATVVSGMLTFDAAAATSYWLQLGVSIGIATLGLVVGSVAVIIGAMLVAPLMGPILSLAMGLATGSPFLVLRSAARIALSVVVVIGGAALITVLLPFHELNPEITGRTAPTVLDLLTAGFCALAGVYATLRPGSDTAATAAGTSIGISLVPPLCASGFGVGTHAWAITGGAALLFLTNLVAIIFVGTLSFVAAGFSRVNAAELERAALADSRGATVMAAIARRLAVLFESRAGPLLRFLMPLLLLSAVYVPLRRALDSVAWEVRVRAAVQDSLAAETHQVVQSRVEVQHHAVDLRLVLLGSNADAAASKHKLEVDLARVSGVTPHVEVLAIPDATAFAGLESTLREPRAPTPPPAAPPPTPVAQLDVGRALIREEVAKLWPADAAGAPLRVDLGADGAGAMEVRVAHLGPALSPAGLEALNRGLGVQLGRPVQLVDVALPAEPLTRAAGDLALVARAAVALKASADVGEVAVCVVQPAAAKGRRRPDPADAALAAALEGLLEGHPRVTRQAGGAWSLRFARGSCAPTEAPPVAR